MLFRCGEKLMCKLSPTSLTLEKLNKEFFVHQDRILTVHFTLQNIVTSFMSVWNLDSIILCCILLFTYHCVIKKVIQS